MIEVVLLFRFSAVLRGLRRLRSFSRRDFMSVFRRGSVGLDVLLVSVPSVKLIAPPALDSSTPPTPAVLVPLLCSLAEVTWDAGCCNRVNCDMLVRLLGDGILPGDKKAVGEETTLLLLLGDPMLL